MGGAPKYAAVNVVIIKCELCSKVFVQLFSTAFFLVYALFGFVYVYVCVVFVCVCMPVVVYKASA